MKRRPLVALSSAAILAIYAAGYVRTRGAADRFAAEAAPRRAPAANPPLVQSPPPLPPVQQGEPVIPPPTRQIETRARAAAGQTPGVTSASAPDVVPEPAAPAPSPAITEFEPPPAPSAPEVPAPAVEARFKDGTYLGWGYCRHGDIQASVVVEAGRITSATIARCLTRYSCSWIEALPGQVVSRQSPEVDYVSGATESTDAFHDAVADAVSKAK